MNNYYYTVNLSPSLAKKEEAPKPGEDQANLAPPCIYLSFKSSNKMYEQTQIRTACQLYKLEEVPNHQAIMPLDYKKLGNVSSSPLVKINVFLDHSVKDSSTTETAAPSINPAKGTATPALSVSSSFAVSSAPSASSSVKKKKFQIMACRTGTDLYTICKNILSINNLKLGSEDWKIKRVTAIDRLLVDVRA